jgi:hypothetical protein
MREKSQRRRCVGGFGVWGLGFSNQKSSCAYWSPADPTRVRLSHRGGIFLNVLMSPVMFLALVGVATLVAAVMHFVMERRRSSAVRKLAQDWQMHYTPDDRFRLADRIAGDLGVPGAAQVRVEDVIYGSEGEWYRYYFTVEYTIGVLRRHHDVRCVCMTTERKQREGATEMTKPVVGQMEVGVLEQYRRLREKVERQTSPVLPS